MSVRSVLFLNVNVLCERSRNCFLIQLKYNKVSNKKVMDKNAENRNVETSAESPPRPRRRSSFFERRSIGKNKSTFKSNDMILT